MPCRERHSLAATLSHTQVARVYSNVLRELLVPMGLPEVPYNEDQAFAFLKSDVSEPDWWVRTACRTSAGSFHCSKCFPKFVLYLPETQLMCCMWKRNCRKCWEEAPKGGGT